MPWTGRRHRRRYPAGEWGRYRDRLVDARQEIDRRVKEGISGARREVANLEQKITEFAQHTGIQLGGRYDGPPIGVVKMARRLSALQGWSGAGALSKLDDLARQLERAAETVRQAAADSGLRPPQEERRL